jgi:uncharacterized BrkB/YihY/UPF0761 family membrane protein
MNLAFNFSLIFLMTISFFLLVLVVAEINRAKINNRSEIPRESYVAYILRGGFLSIFIIIMIWLLYYINVN